MTTLVIITGTSGAGKTLQLKMLEQHYGPGRVLTVTTRPQRMDEANEAYHFVTDAKLTEMESRGETLWVINQYGNQYSITEQSIREALQKNAGLAFVAITPDCRLFLTQWCRNNNISTIGIHLAAPHPNEQRRRMKERDGEKFNPDRIEAHIKSKTDSDELSKKIRIHVIEQSEPGKMFAQLHKLIESTHAPS